jgi:DNA polymerase III alpha subunit
MSTAIANIGVEKANKIWDMMETSSRYSFNASHSYGYFLITYACLFLRHNYPLEWWSAILTNAKQNEISGKLWAHVKHLVAAPDINLSSDEMEIDYANRKIRAKLGVIRGIGDKTIDPIVQNRPYKDIQDFVNREVAGPGLTRKLAHVGVLDSLFPANSTLVEKIQAYENAVETKKHNATVEKNKVTGATTRAKEPKKGTVPEEYLNMEKDPMKNAATQKAILPSLLVGLFDLGRNHSKCIVGRDKPSKLMTNSNGKESLLVTGEQLQRLDEMHGDSVSEDKYVAATGFVVETKIFDYKNNTCQALKCVIDFDGQISERVLWPDFNSKQLIYPKELKKGNIVTVFLKKRAGKNDACSIQEVVIES